MERLRTLYLLGLNLHLYHEIVEEIILVESGLCHFETYMKEQQGHIYGCYDDIKAIDLVSRDEVKEM
jgi:hypothetical protein